LRRVVNWDNERSTYLELQCKHNGLLQTSYIDEWILY
jgi:hypothetical protein